MSNYSTSKKIIVFLWTDFKVSNTKKCGLKSYISIKKIFFLKLMWNNIASYRPINILLFCYCFFIFYYNRIIMNQNYCNRSLKKIIKQYLEKFWLKKYLQHFRNCLLILPIFKKCQSTIKEELRNIAEKKFCWCDLY